MPISLRISARAEFQTWSSDLSAHQGIDKWRDPDSTQQSLVLTRKLASALNLRLCPEIQIGTHQSPSCYRMQKHKETVPSTSVLGEVSDWGPIWQLITHMVERMQDGRIGTHKNTRETYYRHRWKQLENWEKNEPGNFWFRGGSR